MAKCVVCFEPARHPKLLSCLHSVCSRCVEHIARDAVTVSCPRCLRQTSAASVFLLPNDCLSALHDNESAENLTQFCEECAKESEATCECLDCGVIMCGLHGSCHPLNRATAEHQVRQTLSSREDSGETKGYRACPRCPIHPSKTLSFFCKTCCKSLCEQCREAGAHGGESHNVMPSSEAAREQRQELSDMRRKISQPSKSTEIRTALDEVVSTINALNSATETASAEIERNVEELISMLRQRERELLDKLEELRWKKLEPLERQREDLEKRLSDAERTTHYCEKAVEQLSDEQLLESSGWLRDNLQSVALFEYNGLAADSYVAFIANRASIDACLTDGFGVVTNKQVDPTSSTLELPPESQSLVDGTTVKTLLTVCEIGGERFTGNLAGIGMRVEVINANNEKCQVQIEEKGTNKMVSFTPDGAGQYQVVAMGNNNHIRGSPLTLNVKPFSPELTQSWRQDGGHFVTVNSGIPITLPQREVTSEKPFQVQFVIRGKKEQYTMTTDVGCHISTYQPNPYCNQGGSHGNGYGRCPRSGTTYPPAQWRRRIQVNLTCPGCSHSTWYCQWNSNCGGLRNYSHWQVPLSLQTSVEASQ